MQNVFLSTPSARRATAIILLQKLLKLISIHALREEGDPAGWQSQLVSCSISIHALREEGDFIPQNVDFRECISIHALREEGDSRTTRAARTPANFYPRPPRGGRRLDSSIFLNAVLFLSTPSARRATVRLVGFHGRCRISIHALREEGDAAWPRLASSILDFYPRPPRGGRRHHRSGTG